MQKRDIRVTIPELDQDDINTIIESHLDEENDEKLKSLIKNDIFNMIFDNIEIKITN